MTGATGHTHPCSTLYGRKYNNRVIFKVKTETVLTIPSIVTKLYFASYQVCTLLVYLSTQLNTPGRELRAPVCDAERVGRCKCCSCAASWEPTRFARLCEEVPMAVVAGLLCFYTCMQVATYYGRVVEMWIHSSGTKSFSRFSLLGE